MYFWSEPEFAVKTALMVKIWMIFFKSGKNSVAVSRSSKGFGTADSDVHPPPYIRPRKIQRKLFISSTESVVIDSKFFESLKNDADPNHRESKTCFYNGIYYRSTAEVDIARYYTENGIPFKYEPEIWLKGLNRPIYTDFVILIRELDLCKFHEHIGMKNSADYNRITAIKYNNYSGAGLVPELDSFYTYDLPGIPFDLRTVPIKVNSVVHSSLFLPDTPYI